MPTTSFTTLSWNDLEEWAGPVILQRGKSYRCRVHNLALTDENHLVATVAGSEPYLTRVWLKDDGPDYECSCPYWTEEFHPQSPADLSRCSVSPNSFLGLTTWEVQSG
jgi:uncharacterized Zn finger protein